MSLKQKTVHGLFWSFSDSMMNYIVHFIIGIIMARLLTPSEFGLIGMITVFIAVSRTFIDSGLGEALIRKQDADLKDFSTVFFFNLGVSLLFYILFIAFAGVISNFYNEPSLKSIIKVLCLTLIINAFSTIQKVNLTKKLEIKLQTKISVTTSIISGIFGIYLAYNGFGVWSLVWRTVAHSVLDSLFLWIFSKWKPAFIFSYSSFKLLFSFSSKLLIAGIINTLYENIYLLIIGKFFNSAQLGYYTRADQFQRLPSTNITSTVQRITYPVLSTLQSDLVKVKAAYQKMISTTMFFTFSAMIGMAAVAKSMIITTIGEKWLASVPYLQLLCFAGMLYPLHAMNLNVLKVRGRSDLFLRLEIIKKLLAVPVIIIGIFIGIRAMIIGMILNSFIAYFINSYYSGKLINYSVKEQIKDVLPSFVIAIIVGLIVFIPSLLVEINPMVMLVLQILSAFLLLVTFSELIGINGYLELKILVLGKFRGLNNRVKEVI